MSNISTRPLGMCARFVSGGTPSMQRTEYWGGDIPWVSAKDLKTLTLRDSQDHVTALGAANGTRMVNQGTILMLVRGMTLHHDVPICVAGRQLTFNQDIKALIPAEGIQDRYLLYALHANKPDLLAMVDSAGHGTGRLNTDQLKSLSIPMPPLPEQKRIAHILGTLDDKIELNRRMNETLEAMGRALFKSWFVDFDPVSAKIDGRKPEGLDPETAALFPSLFHDSPMGPIPKGWTTGTIGDIAEVIDCLHAKKPERTDTGHPYLQLNNIRDDGLLDLSDMFLVSTEAYRKWISRMEAKAGDCVITNVGRVGAVAQIPEQVTAALGRNMTGIRCKPHFAHHNFLIECLLSQSMRDEIVRKMDSGTILDALNVKSIPKLRFTKPTLELAKRFEAVARPLRKRMEDNLRESHTLATMRDTLLPKLLSVKLRQQGEKECSA